MSIDDYRLSKDRVGPEFKRATRADRYGPIQGDAPAIVQQRALEQRVIDLRAKARAHYAEHRDHWINREVNRITLQRDRAAMDGPQISGAMRDLAPRSNTTERIRDVATRRVEGRHIQRMARLTYIHERLSQRIVERHRSRTRE